MRESVDYRLAELERRMWNILRLGVIETADYSTARVKVRCGDLVTGWIPWMTRRAGADADWWAPEEGEQVLLLSPCGDPAQAVALPALYQTAYPAPDDSPDKRRIVFEDGTVVLYDRSAKKLSIECAGDVEVKAAGQCDLDCQGPITIKSGANVTVQAQTLIVEGDISASGGISASGSITDATGNTNHHSHP
jgi:phage baseplate assembly protein V